MLAEVKELLISGDDLDARGDFYAGRRLPEFRVHLSRVTDFSINFVTPELGNEVETHPMRIVGRYLACEIHNDESTNNLNLIGSSLRCQQSARKWHERFTEGGFYGEFGAHWTLTRELPPLSDQLFVTMVATMAQVAMERIPRLKPAEALFVVSGYLAETESAEGWLTAGAGNVKKAVRPIANGMESWWRQKVATEIRRLAVSAADLAAAELSTANSSALGIS